VSGANIEVCLDDELKLDYTDSGLSLIPGGFSFEITQTSHALFDDMDVRVSELTQMRPL